MPLTFENAFNKYKRPNGMKSGVDPNEEDVQVMIEQVLKEVHSKKLCSNYV